MSFAVFPLSPEIHRSIRDRGHHEATPIQSGAIPVILSGRDVVATAETGSGKTAAFLIPVIDRLHRTRPPGPSAVVIEPTRELAAQVYREFSLLARHTRLRAAVIVGGDSMRRQMDELRKGVDILIACPGRLIDHLERGTTGLANVSVVVIDEADRLLDMGFLPQLRRIMKIAPQERQTLMFSATMDSGAGRMAREFLHEPERVNIGDKAAPPESIRQTICPVTASQKTEVLLALLRRPEVESAIVFTRTRDRTDRVAKMLKHYGLRAVPIHGDRSQGQRNAALAGFRKGTFRIMVATDVAARGLDIDGVSHVINFDLPEEPENYIHRIGRTARMGREGIAISLVTPEERASLGRIERALGIKLERETVDGFVQPEIAAPKPVTLFRTTS
ncbi:MAG TPA: DEAD/DEAH box helicase, partial [Candidatus Binataceae bacterium]|nr:DEAD/DEAH box helicase [Candidatus Binataceae bacterium]